MSQLERIGLAVCLCAGLIVGVGFAFSTAVPTDTDVYWTAAGNPHPYSLVWANQTYVYPPPFAQLLGLAKPLGWPVFVAVWTVLIFGGLWLTTRRFWPVLLVSAAAGLLWGLGTPAATPVTYALIGNVGAVLGGVAILGFRYPAAWAIPLLTKVGPGIGVLWFAFRGEWRALTIALGVTGSIVVVSLAIAPSMWSEYVAFLAQNMTTPPPADVIAVPLVVRLVIATGILWWGARSDRRWVIPLAIGISSPAQYVYSALPIWLAALPLMGTWKRPRPAEDSKAGAVEPTAGGHRRGVFG